MKTWAHYGKRVRRCKTSEMFDEICAKKIDLWMVATFLKDCGAFWHSLLAELHCWQCLVWMEELTLSVTQCVPFWMWCMCSPWPYGLHSFVQDKINCLNRTFPLAAEILLPSISWSVIPTKQQNDCTYHYFIHTKYQRNTYQCWYVLLMLVCIGICKTYQYVSSVLSMYWGMYCGIFLVCICLYYDSICM